MDNDFLLSNPPEFDSELHGMRDGLYKSVNIAPIKPIASDLTLRLAVDHGESDVETAARPRNNLAKYLPKNVDGVEYIASGDESSDSEPTEEPEPEVPDR